MQVRSTAVTSSSHTVIHFLSTSSQRGHTFSAPRQTLHRPISQQLHHDHTFPTQTPLPLLPGQSFFPRDFHTTPHLTLHDGRPPPHLHHPLPRRRVPLLRRRRAPRRLLRLRGHARPPLRPPGPAHAHPPPRRPRQAQSRRRQRRVGQLRVRALRGGGRERHPGRDRVGPGEAGADLLRGGRRRVLRQPDRAAGREGGAHRRDRQVLGAAAARSQLPQRGRGQPARRAGAGDRAGVRDRLQRAHRHRDRHRHIRRAARVGGPRADRAARAEDHRRSQRPDQDPHRPGAHRRIHRAVRERQLQLHRHERPQADRRDRIGVRDASRCPRRLIGFHSTTRVDLMLSNCCHHGTEECWPSSDQHISTCDRGGLSGNMWMGILFCKNSN